MSRLLRIGWIEFLWALLLGAPVKDKAGRVWRLPRLGNVFQRVLDRNIWGIDISKWQGIIDWAKVKAAGIRFLILRCSYGIWPDERFVSYITDVIKIFVGWLIGVYHYYDPRYSPKQQTDVLLKTIAPYRKYIRRVWIDLEFTWGGSYEASSYWKEFAEIILAAGYDIGFYTRATWWDSRVGSLASWFAKFPLWAAQYSSALTLIPKGWLFAALWQDGTPLTADFFPAGTMDQSKQFDHDIADDEFYKSEWGGNVPPDGGNTMEYVVGKTTAADSAGGLRVRQVPNGTIIGFLPYLSDVEGWLESGWINILFNGADAYISAEWVNYQVVDPPTPPTEPTKTTVTVDVDDAGNVSVMVDGEPWAKQ